MHDAVRRSRTDEQGRGSRTSTTTSKAAPFAKEHAVEVSDPVSTRSTKDEGPHAAESSMALPRWTLQFKPTVVEAPKAKPKPANPPEGPGRPSEETNMANWTQKKLLLDGHRRRCSLAHLPARRPAASTTHSGLIEEVEAAGQAEARGRSPRPKPRSPRFRRCEKDVIVLRENLDEYVRDPARHDRELDELRPSC